jgi:protein N-terminal methyltransferase
MYHAYFLLSILTDFVPEFNNYDLVETSPRLINAAKEYMGEDRIKCKFICEGLQNFHPEPDSYDIIWVQWVIGYLTDWDLCNFFNRMGKSLRKGGVVVIKDNTCNDLAFMSDKDDSDVTRSFQYLMAILKESGLEVAKSSSGKDLIRWQDDFPDDIWPVPMIAMTKSSV